MMNTKRKPVQALREKQSEFAAITIEGLEPVQEHSYHLLTTPSFSDKWISSDDVLGQNELRVNQATLNNQL